MMNTNKRLITALALVTLLGASALWVYKDKLPFIGSSLEQLVTPKARPTMTVFMHGSFGTSLGLLNAFQVISDDIRGTTYHQITKKMRQNPYFYKDQPILERGLKRLEPTLDPEHVDGKKHAAYPLIKAYENILSTVNPNHDEQLFYTFGWTGLLGQKPRRYESIRLFNALSEELERLAQQGIYPKIKLICHSHGANVVLNVGLINEVLAGSTSPSHSQEIADESYKLMTKQLAKLPSKNQAAQKPGQKRLDYYPERTFLPIDELVMFGCPLQPETDHMIFSKTFGRVYNFYSKDDMVQKMDWVSTKRGYSKQRLEPKDLAKLVRISHLNQNEATNKLVQARLMVNRTIGEAEQPAAEPSFWQQLLTDVGLFSKKSRDPSHKELWFISWKNNNKSKDLAPLPMMILTPLFMQALHAPDTQSNDVDLNITFDDEFVSVTCLPFKQHLVSATSKLSAPELENIKKQVMLWKPDEITLENEFNMINEYKSVTTA